MSNLIQRKTPFLLAATALSVLGSLACLFGLTVVFALLGPLHSADVALQLKIHALQRPWLDAVMHAFTMIGAIKTFLSALAVVLLALLLRGRRPAAALLSYAIAGALILNFTLKELFHRARPALPWSIGDEPTYSFPSGHAFFSATLYGTLCWLALRRGTRPRRIVPLAILLPAAIGISRIYLGEHYPSDVLAGWLAGTLWTGTIILIARLWHSTHPRPS